MTTDLAGPCGSDSSDLFGGTGAEAVQRDAHLSPCRRYRYALWRRWGDGPHAMFIGLNPSTADETADDPTIRRCIAFARAWGYGALCMANLFAYRATQPADMLAQDDPVGPATLHSRQYENACTGALMAVH